MQFFFSRPMYFFMLNTNAYIYIHIHTRIYMYQYGVTDMSVDNSACAFVSHIIDSSQDERLKSNYLPERRRRTLRVPVNRRLPRQILGAIGVNWRGGSNSLPRKKLKGPYFLP